jgi:hypothetical protein
MQLLDTSWSIKARREEDYGYPLDGYLREFLTHLKSLGLSAGISALHRPVTMVSTAVQKPSRSSRLPLAVACVIPVQSCPD